MRRVSLDGIVTLEAARSYRENGILRADRRKLRSERPRSTQIPRWSKLWWVAAVGVVIMSTLACGRGSTSAVLAADDNDEYRDFSFSGSGMGSADYGPTGAKPQSKLWFNDGYWWGVFFDTATEAYQIFRYDSVTQDWRSTGTAVDERNSSKVDALWDGTHLYVVSAGPSGTGSLQGARLLRYGYDPVAKSYS